MPCEGAVSCMSCRVHAASCTPKATPHHTNRSSKKKKKIEAKGRRAIHSFVIHSFVLHTKRESVSSKGKVGMTSLRRPLLFETLDPSPRLVSTKHDGRSENCRRTQRSWDWPQSGNPYLFAPFFTSRIHPHTALRSPLTLPAADRNDFFLGGKEERARNGRRKGE
jgi:hypothetical protein